MNSGRNKEKPKQPTNLFFLVKRSCPEEFEKSFVQNYLLPSQMLSLHFNIKSSLSPRSVSSCFLQRLSQFRSHRKAHQQYQTWLTHTFFYQMRSPFYFASYALSHTLLWEDATFISAKALGTTRRFTTTYNHI